MSPSQPHDAIEVRQTLAGEQEAFGRLYDRHAAGVRSVVAAVSCDLGAVEDLTQETFLRAYRQLASLRNTSKFAPWVHGIARLVARERRKVLARNREQGQPEDVVCTQLGADVRAERADELAQLQRALTALPERERLVLHAYYFHEERADEAAKRLGMSRSGFYQLLRAARQRLHRQLTGQRTSHEPTE